MDSTTIMLIIGGVILQVLILFFVIDFATAKQRDLTAETNELLKQLLQKKQHL